MKKNVTCFCCILILAVSSCTFDYGETEPSDINMPDLVMENVEYVRVRSADPIARIQAERAERYEKQGIMKLQQFSFEQYGERGEEINSSGSGGNAEININSGDIFMDNGVRLEVESEDIIIETFQLEWKDESRIFSTGEDNNVYIFRQNGTSFMGTGLSADARRRTWEFAGEVSGTYINENDEEELEEQTEQTEEIE
jgi:LPS export ABC transporter protein LptC